MRFAMSSWPLLRSTRTQRLSRCFCPAYITASQIGPSCSSPSPVRQYESNRGDDRPAIAKPCATAKPLSHRAGRDVDARQDRSGVAVEDAVVGTRVAKDRTVEVAELGVDRRQRGDRVALAQHEEILAPPRGIDDVDVHEPAVVQRHERDRRRERAAGVEALVHGVAALLEAEEPDIGVLDRQQLQDALRRQ